MSFNGEKSSRISEPTLNTSDERIPSSSGTPSVSFNKDANLSVNVGGATIDGCCDENRSPNVNDKTAPVVFKLGSETFQSAVVASKVAESFADVSMMSVDGNATFDALPKTPLKEIPMNVSDVSMVIPETKPSILKARESPQMPETEVSEENLPSPIVSETQPDFFLEETVNLNHVGESDSTRSQQVSVSPSERDLIPKPTESSPKNLTFSAEGENLLGSPGGSLALQEGIDQETQACESGEKTVGGEVSTDVILGVDDLPVAGSCRMSDANKTFDKTPLKSDSKQESSFEEFTTPTQDYIPFYKQSTAHKDALNKTFEKAAFPEIANLNDTFNKDDEDVEQTKVKTPEFELRLEASLQVGDSISKDSPVELDFGDDQRELVILHKEDLADTGLKVGESVTETAASKDENGSTGDDVDKPNTDPHAEAEPAATDPEEGEDRFEIHDADHKSALKRRCSSLELSLVTSPKRLNSKQTPIASRRNHRSSLINFNESIAFDFSSAAKTAENNGGLAEMGSFVFSASSGLPVAEGADPFDLSMLQKLSSTKNPDQYTRVSFIAMFDPIKVQENPRIEEIKKKVSTPFRAPSSPLVKGLSVPAFAVQKKTCGTQTAADEKEIEDICNGKEEISRIAFEVEEKVIHLNDLVLKQRDALRSYEEVVKILMQKLSAGPASDPKQIVKLNKRIDEETAKNEHLVEYTRTMEVSMKSMLKMTSDHRDSNELLRNTVEEQQTVMNGMNDELKKLNAENEEIMKLNDLCQQQLDHWQSSAKSNEKNVAVMKLQLQAKDSEIDSLNQQASIMKKEVESLRKLVKTMNMS